MPSKRELDHSGLRLGGVKVKAHWSTSPPRVRVRWDEPDGADDVTTVLNEHVTPTTAP